MRRWHSETHLMLRRWREEVKKHAGETSPECHCLRGKGFMRKRRPYGGCAPSQHCSCCETERAIKHRERRHDRRQNRVIIELEIAA